jgi:hypothetical protein
VSLSILDIRDLTAFSSSTRAVLTACTEAASVLLWRFHKAPQSAGTWEHDDTDPWSFTDSPVNIAVLWDEPTPDALTAHGNEKDATEDGAYALAIAVADALGFKVLGRAHQGSGSDWLMVRKGEPASDYYKLEVSGMARINAEKPEARLAAKLAQGRGGDLRRPGLGVVARFEDLRILSEAWR